MKLKNKFGYSLVESMITLGLSSFILIAATQIFISTQRINQKVINDRVRRTNTQVIKDDLVKILKNSIFMYQYVNLSNNDSARPIPKQINPVNGTIENIPVVFSNPDGTRNESSQLTSLDLPYIKTIISPAQSKPGNVLMFITSELKSFSDMVDIENISIKNALDNVKNYYDDPTTNTLNVTDLTIDQRNEIKKAKVMMLTLNCLYLRDMTTGFENQTDKALNSGAKELILYKYSSLYKLQPDPIDPNKQVVQAYLENLKGNLGEAGTSNTEWQKYTILQQNASAKSRLYEAKVLEYLTYALSASGYRGWGENYISNIYDVTGVYHGGKVINPFSDAIIIRGTSVQNIIDLPSATSVPSKVPPFTTTTIAKYIVPPTSNDNTKLFLFDRQESEAVIRPVGFGGEYSVKDYNIRGVKINLNTKKILPNGKSEVNDNIFLVELPKLPKK